MIAALVCAVVTCLVAEGTARTCDRTPGETVIHRQAITYADVADLRPTLIDSVEVQACRRISIELTYPVNHRFVERWIERPQPQTAQETRR